MSFDKNATNKRRRPITPLLQGLAVCGHCGRKLRTHYTGRTASPGYHCAGKRIENERGLYCLNVGAIQIDDAVAQAVLTALAPLGIEAALAAAERIEADHDAAQLMRDWEYQKHEVVSR